MHSYELVDHDRHNPTPEEVTENINVPIGCGKVLRVRRLNYKVTVNGETTWKPSQTVVLTFDGQILPKRIFMYYNALSVELYRYPTIQCYNCCQFARTKIQCRSKPRSFKCSQDHSGDTCNIEEEKIVVLCWSCLVSLQLNEQVVGRYMHML